jgi:hypothetical protein
MFPLPQLKDSTNVHEMLQLQAGYFEAGIIYIQTQALNLLDQNSTEGLLVKEAFRFANMNFKIGLSNQELEEFTRIAINDPEKLSETKISAFINAPERRKAKIDELNALLGNIDGSLSVSLPSEVRDESKSLKRSTLAQLVHLQTKEAFNFVDAFIWSETLDSFNDIGFTPRWIRDRFGPLEKVQGGGLAHKRKAWSTIDGSLMRRKNCDRLLGK